MSDGTCTWWLDGWPWYPTQWLHCCLEHDAGASDIFLRECVIATGGAAVVMGWVMYWGVKRLGPLYRWLQVKREAWHQSRR